jgi:hypothetical protein
MMGIIAKYDLNHFLTNVLIKKELKVNFTYYLP